MRQVYVGENEVIADQSKSSPDVRRWLFRTLSLWPYFLLSIGICVALAYLSIRYTNPLYRIGASVMVKDEKKGGETIGNPLMEEMGFGNSSKLVENEVEVLKSYDLMDSVVNDLKLYVTIKHMGRLRDVELFNNGLPFEFDVLNPNDIDKKQLWELSDTTGGVLMQSTSEEQSIYVRFNEPNLKEGIHFVIKNKPFESFGRSKVTQSKYIVQIQPAHDASLEYAKNLSIEAVSKTATVLKLEIDDPNEERAVAVLNSLINIYNQQGLREKNRVTDSSIVFLNQRLDSVAFQLEGVENSVQSLKIDNNVTDIPSDAQQLSTASFDVRKEVLGKRTELKLIKELRRKLEQNKNVDFIPSTYMINDPTFLAVVANHELLVKKKLSLNTTTGRDNPLVIEGNRQVEESYKALIDICRELESKVTVTLDAITDQSKQSNEQKSKIPTLEKKYGQITRNKGVQEELYSFLLTKREEAAISKASNVEDSRIVLKPRKIEQLSPKPKKVLGLGIIVGMLLPIMFMIAARLFNTKIGDAEEVKEETGLPIIGEITHIKRIRTPIVINSKSRSLVAEQIRSIRTAISFTKKGSELKTVLVTSFQPGDGKSFVSLNLGAAFSLLEKRTIILEFDLRKPQISKNLGLTESEGISSILAGKKQVEEVVVEVPGYNENLYILPAGILPPNPAELISGPRMKYLIDELHRHFDYIIIDTPPFSLVTESTLLREYADLTLIVLRQAHTFRSVYSSLTDFSQQDPSKSTYLLLNDTPSGGSYKTKYGYSKKGYVYHNDYYSEE